MAKPNANAESVAAKKVDHFRQENGEIGMMIGKGARQAKVAKVAKLAKVARATTATTIAMAMAAITATKIMTLTTIKARWDMRNCDSFPGV